MTIHQGSTSQAEAVAAQRRRVSAASPVVFTPMAMASIALTLVGFHAGLFSNIAFGTALALPVWVASTIVIAVMWTIVAVRSGYRMPLPTSSIIGALFLVGAFAWTSVLALSSIGPIPGLAGPTELVAGITIFLIVASLVAQVRDVDHLNRMIFFVGSVASGVLLMALALGADGAGLREFDMLPGLLALSLMAGLSPGFRHSLVWWFGLSLTASALSLAVRPESFLIVAPVIALFLVATPALGGKNRLQASNVALGIVLAALLLTGLMLFNNSFQGVLGKILGAASSFGADSFLSQTISAYGWVAGSVSIGLFGAFVVYASLKAIRLFNMDRQSALWTFGLMLAIFSALALSASYQPLIWLTAAVIVGRYSHVKRVANFRKRLDSQP